MQSDKSMNGFKVEIRQTWQSSSLVPVMYNDLDTAPNSFDHENSENYFKNRYPTHL